MSRVTSSTLAALRCSPVSPGPHLSLHGNHCKKDVLPVRGRACVHVQTFSVQVSYETKDPKYGLTTIAAQAPKPHPQPRPR